MSASPLMIRRLTKELDISHFSEPFDSDEADISILQIELNLQRKRVVNRASEFW
ncbi:MAG TPA: hypothetical protein VIP53_03690 [Nitrososphaera sp.]